MYEAASYFQVPVNVLRRRVADNPGIRYAEENKMECQARNGSLIQADIQKAFPGCKFTVLDTGVYCWKNDHDAIKIGHVKNKLFRTFSPKGMIIMAYVLANGCSEDNRRVAKLVVDACEAARFFDPPRKEPVMPDPMPSNPITEPKLDPAQTLRQMFDAMLNLLDKQAEERGAEKIIQKLKEEGKL